jgi:hypothetical protein
LKCSKREKLKGTGSEGPDQAAQETTEIVISLNQVNEVKKKRLASGLKG